MASLAQPFAAAAALFAWRSTSALISARRASGTEDAAWRPLRSKPRSRGFPSRF